MTYVIGVNQGSQFIRCLVCGLSSYHPEDIAHLYCGKCKHFHEAKPGRILWTVRCDEGEAGTCGVVAGDQLLVEGLRREQAHAIAHTHNLLLCRALVYVAQKLPDCKREAVLASVAGLHSPVLRS